MELAVRRAYDEIRQAGGDALEEAAPAAAVTIARKYLHVGGLSLAEERFLEIAATQSEGPEAPLIRGVVGLLNWGRSGETISAGAVELPERLRYASEQFEAAASEPDLAHLAYSGLAQIAFLDASSDRSNFAAADCERVFDAVERSEREGGKGVLPHQWRAQCERKTGLTREALADYALILQLESEDQTESSTAQSEVAKLQLKMNAFHGIGTVLITMSDVEEDPKLRVALELARDACGSPSDARGSSPLMALSRACLERAVALRRELHQTENQVSGSAENISFTYLRDDDYEHAFAHADKVEKTGLFVWNELIRAMSAAQAGNDHAAKAQQALRNVARFDVGQFDTRELRNLLKPEQFAQACSIIRNTHPDEAVEC